MIFDTLENSSAYLETHPLFSKAFEFIANAVSSDLAIGRHEIDGDNIYGIVAEDFHDPDTINPLEAHRKYIDIQFASKGDFTIGFRTLSSCVDQLKEYDEENDYILYDDQPEFFMTLGAGTFCILYPQDAHSPQHPNDYAKKIVVKVAVK